MLFFILLKIISELTFILKMLLIIKRQNEEFEKSVGEVEQLNKYINN